MRPRLVAAAAALCVAAAALLATGPPAAQASSCDGVWVVVDATAVGGDLQTRCAEGDPSSGLDALRRAGFSYRFFDSIPGMVCKIADRPGDEEPGGNCQGRPGDDYWSYWHAPAGGSWTYSSVGAGSRDPAPGEVEGWRFGSGSPPGTSPPSPPPVPEPEEPESEQPSEEGNSTSSGSSGSTSGGSSNGSNSGGSGNGGSSDGSSGSSSEGSGSGSGDSGAPDEERDEPSPEPSEPVEEPEPGEEPRAIEAAEPAPDVPVDGTAGFRRSPTDGGDESEPDAGEAPDEGDEGEALAFTESSRGAPVGLLVGGALILVLAALTVRQVRQRRQAD